MSTLKRNLGAAGLALVTFAALVLPQVMPSASATTIWREIASGTTHDITGIEYQAADRFWFVTSAGEIFKRQPDGTFSMRLGPTGLPFNDIEFLPGGATGFAVGGGGQVYRSIDNGDTWTNVNPSGSPIPVSHSDTFGDCDGSSPLGEVNAVRFAGTARVWIFAQGAQIAKSEAVDLGAAGTWVDANRDTKGTPSAGDDTCKLGSTSNGIDDGFFVPTNPDTGYICTAFFGEVYLTTNSLATQATKQPADCGNGGIPDRHMAGDPTNPSRMWVVGPGSGRSYTRYTEDGWATSFPFILGSAGTFTTPYDVDYSGGTVLVAGSGGMILNSRNGRKFYFNPAGGTLAKTNWRAVSLATASEGAVGGAGGKLVISPAATQTDVVPPQTTITSAPRAKSHDKTPTFKFKSSEAGSTFKCRIDRQAYKNCTSPKTYGTLRFGDHVFRVKAKDKAGNVDPTAAKYAFKIKRRR